VAAAKALRIAIFAGVLGSALFAQTPRDLYLETAPAGDSAKAVHHLGLRYTILLIDPETRNVREVDPDGILHEGDCFAIEFVPNHSGSLYAFNHGSSGTWQLLMPSPQMLDEARSVKAGEVRRVPSEHCFRLDNKPGVERMVLAITERPDDIRELRESLAKPAAADQPAGAAPVKAESPGDLLTSWQRLTGRDLRLEKIAQPKSAGERPHSVYAVNSSAAESGRLVVEIPIHHE
jgi:hypothetical protein